MKKTLGAIGMSLAILTACAPQQKENLTLSGLNPAKFETLVDGNKAVKLYTLKNAAGMEVCITNFGGRLVSIMVPDKDGKMTDVILGFDNVSDYQNISNDFGASIGRYANRINQGKITIDGVEYQLPQNNYGHCLHGGPDGWQYKVYEAKQLNDNQLELMLNSVDINFVVFNRFLFPGQMEGMFFTLFAIGIAAAETALAIAIIINIFRAVKKVDISEINKMKF